MSRLYYDNSQYREAKAKLSEPDWKHCIICGKDLPKFKRKYCSEKCFRDWYNTFAVKDWAVVKGKALQRDDFKCQDCDMKQINGVVESWMEVHHIKPIKDGGEEFNIDNTITLCHRCHVNRHRVLRAKCKSLKEFGGR